MVAELEREPARSVALCVRMMEKAGLMDYNGHVSLRVAADRILINSYGASRSSMGEEDVVVVDARGQKLEGNGQPPSEIPIHTQIYAVRPDVKCIAHLHSEYITVMSVAGIAIRPVCTTGAVFGPHPIPVFPEPDLVRTPAQGARLASALGAGQAIVLRSHGAVVVASTLDQLLARSLSLERNARLQYKAMVAGTVHFLSAEEVERIAAQVGEMKGIHKSWSYFLDKVGTA